MLFALEILGHHVFEEFCGACGVVDGLGNVKARPRRHDRVGRHAAEPAVLVVVGGTGLADDVPVVDLRVHRACVLGVGDVVVQQTVHDRRCFGRISLLGHLVAVVDDHVALAVGDIVVGVRLIVKTAVAHVGEAGCHLAYADAADHTADGQGTDLVGVLLAELFEAHLGGRLLIGDVRTADHLHDLHRRGVGGILDRVGKEHFAEVGAVGVARTGDLLAVGVGLVVVERLVKHLGGEVELLLFDGDRINKHRLDGRTGLQRRVGRSVPVERTGLALRAADGGDDSAVKVHQHGADLDIGILAAVHVERRFFDIVLHFFVHRAVNAQTLGVDLFACRALADVVELGEVGAQIIDHLVVVPVLYLVLGLLVVLVVVGREALEFQLFGFGERRVQLVLRDLALVIHLIEDVFAAAVIVFGIEQRIPVGRVLRDAGDRRALRQRAVADALAEIQLCRRFHALTVVAVVDDVEIRLQDLLLGVFLLQLERLADLAQLSGDGHLVVVGDVLDQLLGDGGAAVGTPAADKRADSGGGSCPVNAVVVKKALVLDRDLRILHVLRDLGVVHPDAVFHIIELLALGKLAGVRIHHKNTARLVQGFCLEVDTGRLGGEMEDVDAERNQRDHACDTADDERRQHHLAENLEEPLYTALGPFLGCRGFGDLISVVTDVCFTFFAHINSFLVKQIINKHI